MLKYARVTTFTVSELLRENQQGGKITHPPPPRLGLNLRKSCKLMMVEKSCPETNLGYY